jgi:diacylglycerol kinase family enzyme
VEVDLRSEGGEDRSSQLLMLTVSNGRFFGGGFPIAPEATVDDGRLHACMIGDAPPLTRLKIFNLAERGRHLSSDRVEVLTDTSFRIRFAEPPRFEMDGDVRKSSEATIDVRILPGALQLVAPTA